MDASIAHLELYRCDGKDCSFRIVVFPFRLSWHCSHNFPRVDRRLSQPRTACCDGSCPRYHEWACLLGTGQLPQEERNSYWVTQHPRGVTRREQQPGQPAPAQCGGDYWKIE